MAFRIYRQYDSMDCGPACLRMIAKHYGRSLSLQSLREKTRIGKDGVSMLGIVEAAELIGFRTRSVKLSYSLLVENINLPAILHWNQNHFVVLYKIKKNRLYLADPAKGLLVYSPHQFKDCWISDKTETRVEGIALTLETTPEFYQTTFEREEKIGFRTKNLIRYILPYKKLVFQLFIGLGVGSILQLILPFLMQSIVDTGINTSNINFVFIILLAQLALFLGRIIVDFIRGWILLHISTRINISILTDFLIKMMRLPMSFFESKNTGDILQRMTDHKRIETFLTGSSLNVLFSLINLLIFSIVLIILNISVFFVFSIASIFYAIWIVLFLKKRKELDYKMFDIFAKEQNNTIQIVQGMQEIKLNGVEHSIRWSWERLQATIFGLNMKGLSLNQWQQAGALFINEGKNILITFLSAKSVIDGQMTLGSMLAIQYIIGQLNSPIEQMIGFIQTFQSAKISMDRLNEIHTMEDEESPNRSLLKELPASFTRELTGGKTTSEEIPTPITAQFTQDLNFPLLLFPKYNRTDSSIVFQNVTFTYPGAGNNPVLTDINFTIPKGKTTAIVGVSGSGKTTLLKLLLKFYSPDRGDIKLGDISLENISHKAWRHHCGVVMQESFIFSDSIERNIAVGEEKINIHRLQNAANIANLNDFIEGLPLRYSTKIGAEGKGISMGQKQRILIARAVYRDPDFIFFDEATNSLDANNESIIIHNLRSFFSGRTVIVSAHRISTVKNADQILVLNKGFIVEKGTHEELVCLKGEYYNLVKNQLLL